ncbi:MAG TPA: hypothetical protein VFA20_00450 [Myxococcaceae bacterium]|nr:hypothetical protein [Myxococcaceae bacterium]
MDAQSPPPLPTFGLDEKVCGNCKLWSPYEVDHRGWVGPCRVQPQRGLFPGTAPICDAFARRGVPTPEKRGEAQARPRAVRNVAPVVVRQGEERPQPRPVQVPARSRPTRDPDEVVDLGGELTMTRDELMELFREASGETADPPPMASKWQGGVVQILPGNKELQGKEVSVDSLFHKVVMIRDRLRTLEQKINANPKLTDAEKVEIQHYVTRCYGSLTSFNLLFRDKDDQFIGQKGDD